MRRIMGMSTGVLAGTSAPPSQNPKANARHSQAGHACSHLHLAPFSPPDHARTSATRAARAATFRCMTRRKWSRLCAKGGARGGRWGVGCQPPRREAGDQGVRGRSSSSCLQTATICPLPPLFSVMLLDCNVPRCNPASILLNSNIPAITTTPAPPTPNQRQP